MKKTIVLLTLMLSLAACSTSLGVKEELIDENGNVLKWIDCYTAIQEFIGDQQLYNRLFEICKAQDVTGYDEWANKVTSKIRKLPR